MNETHLGDRGTIVWQSVELRVIGPNTGAPVSTGCQKAPGTWGCVVFEDASLSVQRLPLRRVPGDEMVGGQSEPVGG
jgi:hypothetical protein